MINHDEITAVECAAGYKLDTPNSDRARKQAADEGLTVVTAKADQLLIDLDTDADFNVFQRQFATYLKEVGYATYVQDWSKSGKPHRHITVSLYHKITNTERILLQAVLGSDRTRELLSWVQELNGDPNPTLFLEKAQPLLGTTVATALLTEGE